MTVADTYVVDIGMDVVLRLPEPSPVAKELLSSLQVNLPPVLPRSNGCSCCQSM